MSQRNLTAKDILQKEFKPALRGFNTAEVDEYLDLIIRDYESYDKEIAYLKNENERLKRQLNQQESTEDKESATDTRQSNPEVQSTTNYDILKRLSRLEKTVYGQSQSNNDNNNEPTHAKRATRSTDDSDDDFNTKIYTNEKS